MKITVKVKDENTLVYPNGHEVETYSTPKEPPPHEGMYWHDALCMWLDEDEEPPKTIEVDIPDGQAGYSDGANANDEAVGGFYSFLKREHGRLTIS